MAPTLSRLVVAAMLPIVVVTALTTAWAAWYAGRDDREMARLGAEATLGASVTEANSALTGEVSALAALGAIRRPAPAPLRPYLRVASAGALGGSANARTLLEGFDARGARALVRLRQAGMAVGPEAARALAGLPADELRAAARGTPPRSVSAADYAEAITELQAAFLAAPGRTQAAVDRLLRVSGEPPPWRSPAFLGGLAALWALAAAGCLAVAWRVRRALGRAEEARRAEAARADAIHAQNERLLELVDAIRRLSSSNDMRGVGAAVAAEAARLLASEAAAVYLAEDGGAIAVAATGAAAPTVDAAQAGVVMRALDTGSAARAVAPADPAFPGLSPVAALAAPLVAGRRVIGAIAIARGGTALPDDDDETALRLIALAAGPAIESARAYDSTAALALTDPLTGLGNRRRLDRDLADACAPGRGAPVGFVMIDVDHFKHYNDTHGHPAGDALLREVSAQVAACVRREEVVYRFGGEELCVLLPGASDADAAEVAERVRSAIASHDFRGGDRQPGGRLTVSVGVARRSSPDAGTLLADADAALYRAKREGRNRVVAAV